MGLFFFLLFNRHFVPIIYEEISSRKRNFDQHLLPVSQGRLVNEIEYELIEKFSSLHCTNSNRTHSPLFRGFLFDYLIICTRMFNEKKANQIGTNINYSGRQYQNKLSRKRKGTNKRERLVFSADKEKNPPLHIQISTLFICIANEQY